MSRKHALIVVENSFVPFDIRVWYEATTLREEGWHVTVICPSPLGLGREGKGGRSRSPTDLQGVDVFYFPNFNAKSGVIPYTVEYVSAFLWIWRLVWRAWRQERFDVLHICNPPDIFFPVAWFYRLLGAGVIFDHHDLFPEFVRNRFKGIGGHVLYRAALLTEYLTYHCAHVVIAVNESYRENAIGRGRVLPAKVIVVRNGPKTTEFVPVGPATEPRADSRLVACFVGVMGHEDGVLELIDSIRHMVLELNRTDVRFVLVGDGANRTRAMERIRDWGLEGYVDMPGMILDRQKVRAYLAESDIFLSPEPLSPLNAKSTFIKVGEYMAIGRPIVAFDLKETRRTAQDAALYVTPGDTREFAHAIATLADDPDLRGRMSVYARKRFLESLSWEQQKGGLLTAYAAASWNGTGDQLIRAPRKLPRDATDRRVNRFQP